MSESAVAKLLEALRELTPSNEATPVWRELGAEARVRGLARRTFREWCQRMGVAIRDVGGIAYVSPPEVDRVIAQGPVRPTPSTTRGSTLAATRPSRIRMPPRAPWTRSTGRSAAHSPTTWTAAPARTQRRSFGRPPRDRLARRTVDAETHARRASVGG